MCILVNPAFLSRRTLSRRTLSKEIFGGTVFGQVNFVRISENLWNFLNPEISLRRGSGKAVGASGIGRRNDRIDGEGPIRQIGRAVKLVELVRLGLPLNVCQ